MPATSPQPDAEAAESAAEIWALYLEALRRGLRIPPEVAFMAASSSVPLALEIDSAVDPVPLPQALAEVYLYGDTIPRWSTAYLPSADGRVYGQYESFVFAIAVPDRTVEQARALLDEVARQIIAGSGSLVMTIATDAGTSTVPRYDPGPLGKPGYSQWLEQAILAVVNGLPPQVDVTVRADEVAPAAEPALPEAGTFLSALAGEVVALRLVIQSVTFLSIRPGTWFVASLLRNYTRPEDFIPGTPFATQPIWGPDGIFNLIPTGLSAGFRPTVELTLTPEGFARVVTLRAAGAAGAPRVMRIGPFAVDLLSADPEALRLDPAASTMAWTATSLQGMLLGVVADHPNTTQVPG